MSLVSTWFDILKCSPKIAFWNLMTSFYSNQKLRNNLTFYFVERKHKAVLDYLRSNNTEIITKYKSFNMNSKKTDMRRVWILWWQGYDQAPELVKNCIASANKYFKDNKIVVISKDNYQDFISIDKVIIKKFESGMISHAQLSDIFRLNLLSQYGGIWADSTLMFTNEIPDYVSNLFFTLNTGYDEKSYYVTKGRWTGFFMSSDFVHFPFFDFADEIIQNYWKRNNKLIDYFLIDYIIELAYEEFTWFKDIINAIPVSCSHIFSLVDHLSDIATDDNIGDICSSNNWVYKLNHRITPLERIGDNQTIYGKLVEDCYQFRIK